MQICRLSIKNFRGIHESTIILPTHAVLLGDNNIGKTTILEAIDLVLGPERLNRKPPIDEHDFYGGQYIDHAPAPETTENNETSEVAAVIGPEDETAVIGDAMVATAAPDSEVSGATGPRIEIEVTVAHLTAEQIGRFGDYIEFWDTATETVYQAPNPEGVDAATIAEALRVTFIGWYDVEIDDFEGMTYFSRSLTENDEPIKFSKKDKQVCGYLYLRSLRTGSRALELGARKSVGHHSATKRGKAPDVGRHDISKLASYSVASDPQLGISGVLEKVLPRR